MAWNSSRKIHRRHLESNLEFSGESISSRDITYSIFKHSVHKEMNRKYLYHCLALTQQSEYDRYWEADAYLAFLSLYLYLGLFRLFTVYFYFNSGIFGYIFVANGMSETPRPDFYLLCFNPLASTLPLWLWRLANYHILKL